MHKLLQAFRPFVPGMIRPAIALTIVLSSSFAHAAIRNYSVDKRESFQQTSNATPSSPTGFEGLVSLQGSSGDLTTARVTEGTNPISPLVLPPASLAQGVFQFSKNYATQTALDSDLPSNAQYQFAISGGTLGSETATLTTPSTNLFPPVPAFTGTTFSQLQNVSSTGPILFTFNGFTPSVGANLSLIEFQIFDSRFGTFFDTSLPSATTSFLLPANTLDPGISYGVFVNYYNSIFTQNAGFNGASSGIYFSRQTDLSFTTAVPEPASVVLLGVGGLSLLAWIGRRRRQRV